MQRRQLRRQLAPCFRRLLLPRLGQAKLWLDAILLRAGGSVVPCRCGCLRGAWRRRLTCLHVAGTQRAHQRGDYDGRLVGLAAAVAQHPAAAAASRVTPTRTLQLGGGCAAAVVVVVRHRLAPVRVVQLHGGRGTQPAAPSQQQERAAGPSQQQLLLFCCKRSSVCDSSQRVSAAHNKHQPINANDARVAAAALTAVLAPERLGQAIDKSHARSTAHWLARCCARRRHARRRAR